MDTKIKKKSPIGTNYFLVKNNKLVKKEYFGYNKIKKDLIFKIALSTHLRYLG